MLNDFYRRDIYYLFLKEVKFDDIYEILISEQLCGCQKCLIILLFVNYVNIVFFVIYMQIYFGGVFLFQKVILNFIVLIVLDGSLFFLMVVRFGVK